MDNHLTGESASRLCSTISWLNDYFLYFFCPVSLFILAFLALCLESSFWSSRTNYYFFRNSRLMYFSLRRAIRKFYWINVRNFRYNGGYNEGFFRLYLRSINLIRCYSMDLIFEIGLPLIYKYFRTTFKNKRMFFNSTSFIYHLSSEVYWTIIPMVLLFSMVLP